VPAPETPLPVGTGLAGRKALVVDDDIRNVFALTSLLERCEVEVISTQSGQEGVEILERTPDIDVVLMDIMMPIMDGYATMRAMRELTLLHDIPIIAVTAAVEAGERQRCIDAGATAYVTKPVDTASLLLVLGEWLPSGLPGEPPIVAG
jgi:CheY-like chemotaxis protein